MLAFRRAHASAYAAANVSLRNVDYNTKLSDNCRNT